MLTEYIEAAMRKAKYKPVEGDDGFYGKIPGFRGLWAHSKTLDGCRVELRSVLESWLIIKLRHNDNDLPVVKGLDLNRKAHARTKVA